MHYSRSRDSLREKDSQDRQPGDRRDVPQFSETHWDISRLRTISSPALPTIDLIFQIPHN